MLRLLNRQRRRKQGDKRAPGGQTVASADGGGVWPRALGKLAGW